MGKRTEKKQAEFYLQLARLLQEVSVLMGMRSSLGYPLSVAERNTLIDIQDIFFPEQELPEDMPHSILGRAAHDLIDAWAGIPVAGLPPVSDLRATERLARQLRMTPLHG